jgi:hypothetical protein
MGKKTETTEISHLPKSPGYFETLYALQFAGLPDYPINTTINLHCPLPFTLYLPPFTSHKKAATTAATFSEDLGERFSNHLEDDIKLLSSIDN